MLKHCSSIGLLAMLATGLITAQTPAPEIVKPATTAPVTNALVYVSTSKGINLYSANQNGQLSQVPGTYQTSGLMIGSNGKYFISLGTDYVHSYKVNSNGAISSQVSQINTQLYTGSECGTTGGGTLDHSGQYLYVNLSNAFPGGAEVCSAFQTFKINSTTGQLTFNGAAVTPQGRYAGESTPVSVLVNEKFAYAIHDDYGTPDIYALSRESSGTLNFISFGETDPVDTAESGFYPEVGYNMSGGTITGFTSVLAPDNSNHFALGMFSEYQPPFGTEYPAQLASYTVNSSGDITSTNTYANMPTPVVGVGTLNMSPAGNLLAVGGSGGLEVYHFNGGAPITPYSSVLTSSPINAINWDNHNHLYAMSYSTGKLYVFTVTTNTITPVSGSPYKLSGVNGMVAVAK